MEKQKSTLLTFAAVVGLLLIAGSNTVRADTQTIPFTATGGGSGSGCPGTYTGYAKMTNGSGTFWITPPAGTTNGTLTDASGFAAPYVSVAVVKRKSDQFAWCGTNSVTFMATNTQQYALTVDVKSTLPPPTNGQPMTLQITWQP